MSKLMRLSIVGTLLFMGSSAAVAQEFYVRGGVGLHGESGKTEYNNADPNGLTNIQQSTDVTVNADGTTRVKALNGTLGGGFKANLTVGYMFNKYVGAEIGFNYFDGDKKTIGKLSTPAISSSAVAYLRGLDISPSILITPGFDKLNPYARLGALMTGAGKLTIESDVLALNAAGPGTDVKVHALTDVTAKFSIGFAGAVGATYPIGKNLAVFGEIEFKNFSIKSKSAEIKEYVTTGINGNNVFLIPGQQLADLPQNEGNFEFSDEFSGTVQAEDPNKPRTIPTQFVNASGVGVNVGLRYSFGK
ncbi:MAG: outer membrane beta-barrel protein [Flavobacterium sp.]